MRAFLVLTSLLSLAGLAAGCGPVGVGSACYYVGDTNGCVEGAMCTPVRTPPVEMGQDVTWDDAVCRVMCSSPSECTAGYECRAVPGFERWQTCQPIEETP